MRNRLAIFIFFALAVLFQACSFDTKEKAAKLSSELTAVNDSMYHFGRTWFEEFKVAVNTKDFSELPAHRTNLASFIDRKVEYIKKMEDVGGSEKYKQAELDILNFEKNTVLPKFVIFESFTANTTDEEIAEAYNVLMSTLNEEQEKLNVVYKLRDEYAEKNDFPLPVE